MIKNVLVVVAHPDDETIGCGGYIAKLKKNKHKISCLYLADGVSARNTANKKALEKGSIFTHDQGLHDRVDALMNAFFPKGSTPDLVSKTSPNLISPSGTGGAANAQRTAAMQNAMIQKRLDETGGMGSQAVIAPTNVSNSESTNITQTTMSIINPDQIISVINRAA